MHFNGIVKLVSNCVYIMDNNTDVNQDNKKHLSSFDSKYLNKGSYV